MSDIIYPILEQLDGTDLDAQDVWTIIDAMHSQVMEGQDDQLLLLLANFMQQIEDKYDIEIV